MMPDLNKIYIGDCLDIMRQWPDSFVQTVVTSPPYWGLRDYGACHCAHGRFFDSQGEGTGGAMNYRSEKADAQCPKCLGTGRLQHSDRQIGLEQSPEEYTARMVDVFHEAKRILRDDGTLWLNLGDSYFGANWRGSEAIGTKQASNRGANASQKSFNPQAWRNMAHDTLKPKDLVGIPWRVAFALQADGWYLRSDIIWAKLNPMPESVTDRPTKAHEYIFLLTKSEQYFYDAHAIREKAIDEIGTHRGGSLFRAAIAGNGNPFVFAQNHSGEIESLLSTGYRNKRSVWPISSSPFSEAHFATFPPDLIKPCILAGSHTNDIVMDPFMGAGTTALVATTYNRQYLGIELNPDYAAMAERRIANERAQIKLAI